MKDIKVSVIEFTFNKQFALRGNHLTFAKKMWRDGYNKALKDVRNFCFNDGRPDTPGQSETETDIKETTV